MTKSKHRILVVEDNAIAREGLAVVLRREGHPVDLAENGEEALDYLRSNEPPTLILLDMLLPVLDGWRFLQRFNETTMVSKPAVVVTTASPAIGLEWALAHGCSGFIRKPIETEVLLAEVDRCLEGRE